MIEIAEFLIIQNASIKIRNLNGEQPLHVAAEKGHEKVVELLLSKGADIQTKDNVIFPLKSTQMYK